MDGVRSQRGFTLVELVVVMAIMSVLVAIAIPVYAGFADRAEDGVTQSILRDALTAERLHLLDHGVFTTSQRTLGELAPHVEWNVRRNPPGTVRVRLRNAHRDHEVCVYSQSKSGTWFAIYFDLTETKYGEPGRLRGCNASVARNWNTGGW